MHLRNQLKKGNSKGKLANAIILYGRALEHYANESNWAVKDGDILWLGDDDPTYAAALTLGKRKVDPHYATSKAQKLMTMQRPVTGQQKDMVEDMKSAWKDVEDAPESK